MVEERLVSDIQLYNGDCLNIMYQIPDKSIDCIICDLPYGTTQNPWDVIIPFDKLWEHYERVISDNGAIILFGQDKFTAQCMLSNPKLHRYNLIWKKVLPSGFLNANRMPLREHEDIMVFYKSLPTYNPQKVKGNPCHTRGKLPDYDVTQLKNNNYGDLNIVLTEGDMKFPTSIIEFQKPAASTCLHPTQKPVELIEWLVKTYTNPGDTVLDNTMGSGTTGVACANLNRNFIGIELDSDYFAIAQQRINNVPHKLFDL